MKGIDDHDVAIGVPSEDLNGPATFNIMEKYGAERDKRIREEGLNQYIDLRRSERFSNFIVDPWIEPHTPVNTPVPNGGHCKVVIAGAGFGGILFAVKLLQAGFKLEDLLIIDPAGGFGGTWYWNRYPGLMCDVESYIYLPLLEEMGYIPKRRYASGFEIREYMESICSKYGLHDRAMFQSTAKTMTWSETKSEWTVNITKKPKGGIEDEHVVQADFAIIASGLLSNAHLPNIDGLDKFGGQMFHTSRWDYSITGGTPKDPSLVGLTGKKVAFIGTGATAVQAVPELAKHAGQLYIFQRTPSSVDVRDNRDTDPDWFREHVATKQGWQRERNLNFASQLENVEPKPEDLVNDSWSNNKAYGALIGTSKSVTMESIADYIGQLYALDSPRQFRIHGRVDKTVKDPSTANDLKAWYPGWCKRPCFHDEYLQAFNSPNVSLVDTDGKGIDRVTEKGINFGGKEYEVDLIIWGTGFRSPALGSAAGKAEITVTGKAGLEMEEVNNEGDLFTLHGITAHGFPNMYWTGPLQAAATANNSFLLDNLSTHISYIIQEATRRAEDGKKPVLEPTLEAQNAWAGQIAAGAMKFGAMSGCTPSYFNKEGESDRMTPEQQMKAAPMVPWPHGFESYLNILEEWRAEGKLEGLKVQYFS